ncbi:hypothetical protein GT348_08930 (plasmid) [Aristophania vespae]|uniref:Flagellar assembly protein FliH/Type III secretion system HrpE domain-containing protein n=1 Tax=Aristophania vespae TaxID=2697033 RepID=A0A6P1NGW6_9PROT|nr:hypothetical protein [Aristophania vespae]QHI96473.1 hypothetical protein GT348_08930 [Aristophania vespae]
MSSVGSAEMKSFIDNLEDFSLSVPENQESEELEALPNETESEDAPKEEEPEVDESIRLQPEELEALKNQAFEEGRRKGEEEAQDSLSSQMSKTVDEIATFLVKEEARRHETMVQFAQKISDTVYEIIKERITDQEALQRDIIQDIMSFIKECEGEITISCSGSDEEIFKNAFKNSSAIHIKIDPQLSIGRVTISSSDSLIEVDNSEWLNTVRERIMSSVKNVIRKSQNNISVRS